MRFSHKKRTLSDHQPKARNEYEDLSRKKNQALAHRANGFHFFSNKQLTVAVNPRQIKSGVLRDKTIRDYTVYTIGIFNSVSVSVSLSDQDLRILRRQLGHENWKKLT